MATLQPRTASAVPDRQLPHPAPRHPVPEQPTTSEAYRSHAGRYDRRAEAFRPWRELLVDQLPARRGDTVLDVGCGTGLCLPLLQDKVGASGTIVGIDASPKCSRSPATG